MNEELLNKELTKSYVNELSDLGDHIYNLRLIALKLLKENKELKSRIDKAIEYCEKREIKVPNHYLYDDKDIGLGIVEACTDILSILKGNNHL